MLFESYRFISGNSCVLACYLELQLHACDVLSGLHLSQFLYVREEAAGGDLCVAAGDCLQQGVMDEAVLILRLHHVVPLSSHQGHVTVDVHRFLVLDALQHGVDDDEAACAAHAGTKHTQIVQSDE